MTRTNRVFTLFLLVAVMILIAACSGDSGTAGITEPPPPPPVDTTAKDTTAKDTTTPPTPIRVMALLTTTKDGTPVDSANKVSDAGFTSPWCDGSNCEMAVIFRTARDTVGVSDSVTLTFSYDTVRVSENGDTTYYKDNYDINTIGIGSNNGVAQGQSDSTGNGRYPSVVGATFHIRQGSWLIVQVCPSGDTDSTHCMTDTTRTYEQ